MRRSVTLTAAGGLLLLAAGCATPQRTAPQPPGPTIMPDDVPASLLTEIVDRLLLDMASADLPRREAAERELETLCLRAGQPGADDERTALVRVLCARLERSQPVGARAWIVRQLGLIGDAEAVPTLAQLLNDGDEQVRQVARQALAVNPAPAAGGALRDALAAAESTTLQVALLNALASRGDAENEGLFNELAQSSDPDVKLAAIAALGTLEAKPVRLFWYERVRNPAIQAAVADAWLRWAEARHAAGQTEAAREVFEHVWKMDVPTPQRCGALRGLSATRGPLAVPTLLNVVADGAADGALRGAAAELLGSVAGGGVPRAIAAEVELVEPEAQVYLLRALASRGDAAVVPTVVKLLDAEDEAVRIEALRTLAVLGNYEVAPLLLRAAARASGAEQEAARQSLARLRGPYVDETLLGELEPAGPPLRIEVARALAARWYRPALPRLLREAEHADEEVRLGALAALEQLALPHDAADLVRLLVQEKSETVRTAALDAVVAASLQQEDEDARVAPLLRAWRDANADTRVWLIRACGRIGGAAALEQLHTALRDASPVVSDAAVRALAKWQTPDALGDLRYLAENAPYETHRTLALQGFIRLVGVKAKRDSQATLALYEQALGLAERVEERRLALGGIGTVADVAALKLAQSFLADEELRAEAEAATLATARLCGPTDPGAALAAIEAVAAQVTTDAGRDAAAAAREEVEKTAGNITCWELAGPFGDDGHGADYVFAHAFAPEQPGAPAAWRPLTLVYDDAHPWLFNLRPLKGNNCCAYARCAVWSDADQPARLEIGSDDGVKAWLNNELVHANNAVRSHEPFADSVDVRLRAGWNALLVKIVQREGGWAFSARVRDPAGGPLATIRVRPAPSPAAAP